MNPAAVYFGHKVCNSMYRLETRKVDARCELRWPYGFLNGLPHPSFGIFLRTMMNFRTGDLVSDFFLYTLFPFFPLMKCAGPMDSCLFSLMLLVSIEDVIDALYAKS